MAFKKILVIGCLFCVVHCAAPKNNQAGENTNPGSDSTTENLSIVSTVPEANSTTAAVNAPITVTFSNDVYQFNMATVSQDFDSFVSFKDDTNTSIGHTTSYNSNTFTLTVIPDNPLDYSSTYTLQISKIIKSVTGARLAADYSLVFRTIDDGVSLKNLTLSTFSGSALGFTPAFSPTTTTYAATVSGIASQITVNATALSSRAKVTYNGKSENFQNLPLLGNNVILIKVTSADNKTTSTYTLNVTRQLSAVSNTQYIKKPTPPAFADGQSFAFDLSISNNTLAIGTQTNTVYTYKIDATGKFNLESTILNPVVANQGLATVTFTNFGQYVSISGDFLAIADHRDDSSSLSLDTYNSSATNSGAVYIYKRTGTTWDLKQYIKPFNNGAGDGFGAMIKLSGDVLLVSTIGEGTNSSTFGDTNGILQGASLTSYITANPGHKTDKPNSGAAYIYRRNGDTFQLEAMLKHPAKGGDEKAFGREIAMDDNTIAISTHGSSIGDSNNDTKCGISIYIYKNNNWVLEQSPIVPADFNDAAHPNANVSASGHNLSAFGFLRPSLFGDNLFVPAQRYDSLSPAKIDSGALYVFTRSAGVWTQQALLESATPIERGRFGSSPVFLNGTLIVGMEDTDTTVNPVSKIHIFYRDQNNAWTHQSAVSPITVPYDKTQTLFGSIGRILLRGDHILVGAPNEDNAGDSITTDYTVSNASTNNYGALYIYR